MFDKPRASHSLGLEREDKLIKGVALSYIKGTPRVDSCFVIPIQSGQDDVKPLYIEKQNEELLQAVTSKHLVVTCLDAQDTLLRHLDVKIKKIKDVDATLSFQAEPLLPYPIENALLDKVILSKEKEGTQLSVFAVRKDHLSQHLQEWNALDIEPEVVSTTSLALAVFSGYFSDTTEPFYAIHIGAKSSFCGLIHQKKLVAALSISSGVDELVHSLIPEQNGSLLASAQELRNLVLAPEQEQHSNVKVAVDKLRLAITRMVYALAKQSRFKEVSQLFITGPGALIGGLDLLIAQSLNKTLIALQPKAWKASLEELHFYALPFGAALSALPLALDQVNFRQQEFAYPSPWKRIKSSMLIYSISCIGLAIAIILFGYAYAAYRESEIKQEYLDLLNVMSKPYGQFEKQIAQREGEIPSPAALTMDQIRQRLNVLEKEIRSTPQIYPLRPNVPLVSDVLAWLSAHAQFVGIEGKATKESASSLQIESFNYTMVKRPEPTKKQEKYQVKVELEFSSPTPKMAREFHDALIAPNELVDPKAEIKWSSNKDRYRTSFFLKDKTQYPGL